MSAFVEIPKRLIKRINLTSIDKRKFPTTPQLHPEVKQWLIENDIKTRFHRVSSRLWFNTEAQAIQFKLNMGRWDHIKDPLAFEISKINIQAKSRVLRATWGFETKPEEVKDPNYSVKDMLIIDIVRDKLVKAKTKP